MKTEIALAIRLVEDLFPETKEKKAMPENATKEELWDRILELENKGIKIKKPRVESAVRVLVEHSGIRHLDYALLAEIIREVYEIRGFTTRCSDSSIRWYLSQCRDWTPKRRLKFKPSE